MPSLAFPKSHHLRSPREFDAVYAAKTREARGPVTVYAKPNELGHPRLGMSVSRKVGTAVRRNRIRRLLREAMRLMQHDFPAGYDLVIVVRPHEPLMLADYQRLLAGAVLKLHNVWRKRAPSNAGPAAGNPNSKISRRPSPAPSRGQPPNPLASPGVPGEGVDGSADPDKSPRGTRFRQTLCSLSTAPASRRW